MSGVNLTKHRAEVVRHLNAIRRARDVFRGTPREQEFVQTIRILKRTLILVDMIAAQGSPQINGTKP